MPSDKEIAPETFSGAPQEDDSPDVLPDLSLFDDPAEDDLGDSAALSPAELREASALTGEAEGVGKDAGAEATRLAESVKFQGRPKGLSSPLESSARWASMLS